MFGCNVGCQMVNENAAVNALVAKCLECFRSSDPSAKLPSLLVQLQNDEVWTKEEKRELEVVIRKMYWAFAEKRGLVQPIAILQLSKTSARRPKEMRFYC
jgi:hypothetical protein